MVVRMTPDTYRQRLRRNLFAVRWLKRITRPELVGRLAQLGVTTNRQRLRYWETGSSDLTFDQAVLWSQALGVELPELMPLLAGAANLYDPQAWHVDASGTQHYWHEGVLLCGYPVDDTRAGIVAMEPSNVCHRCAVSWGKTGRSHRNG